MTWMERIDNGKSGRGILFVISSVSGGGKTTLIKDLMTRVGDLHLSVSHTTRSPRDSEVDGRDYHFVTREEFETLVQEKLFLEWAEVYGELYGTSKSEVEGTSGRGEDVILDIDVQGAMQVRRQRPDAVLVFILPPSEIEQARRLDMRGTETEEERARRLKAAREELAYIPDYDYAVRNDILEEAVQTVRSIVVAARCRPGTAYASHGRDRRKEEE
ncbi:MAG: guanylate kinase [bacterium]|nr:MAG: guanylate kinase [bacterium]